MSQDDVNDQFRSMMFTDAIQETDEVIRQIVGAEAEARHAHACNGDPESAQEYANAAFQVLQGVSLRLLPSVVMGMADLFNREHEAYTLLLDHVSDIAEHLRQFVIFRDRGDTAMASASLGAISSIIDQAFESAIYEKTDEAS